jgi:hypothetical protein
MTLSKKLSVIIKKVMAYSYMAFFHNGLLPIPVPPSPLLPTLLLWSQIRMKDAS